MQFYGNVDTIGNDVLPAELIGDSEPIVGVGIHQIEGVVKAVYRILVAASNVVADEDPWRPPVETSESFPYFLHSPRARRKRQRLPARQSTFGASPHMSRLALR